jgi:hypothetical protein
MATPSRPRRPSAAGPAKNASGSGTSTPAPAPVRASAATAPPVPEALEPAQGGVEDGAAGAAVHIGHEADAAGVALVASPVVQGPAASAGAWQEVVRHLASESTAWDRRQDASLDNDVQGHERRRLVVVAHSSGPRRGPR